MDNQSGCSGLDLFPENKTLSGNQLSPPKQRIIQRFQFNQNHAVWRWSITHTCVLQMMYWSYSTKWEQSWLGDKWATKIIPRQMQKVSKNHDVLFPFLHDWNEGNVDTNVESNQNHTTTNVESIQISWCTGPFPAKWKKWEQCWDKCRTQSKSYLDNHIGSMNPRGLFVWLRWNFLLCCLFIDTSRFESHNYIIVTGE